MKHLILTALIFSFGISHAINVRVIGEGGATPEMKALTSFSNLVDLMPICLSEGNPCKLASGDLELLIEAYTIHQSLNGALSLGFHDDSSEKFIFDREGRFLSVQGKLFHQTVDGLDGFEWLVLGYLQFLFDKGSAELESYPSVWRSLAQSFSPNLNWNTGWIRVLGSSLKVVNFSGRFKETRLFQVSSEGQSIRDLTNAVLNAVQCRSGHISEIQTSPVVQALGFHGDVKWVCDGEKYQGLLYGEWKNEAWVFDVFSIRSFSETPSPFSCLSLLKSPHNSY